MSQRNHQSWNWSTVGLWLGVATVGFCHPSYGRPVADNTLGAENSRVIDRSARDFDVDGGARRGRNLFHSFQEFGVDEGGSVYFLNPDGVENIFSRVTGANRSDILGTLGVRGGANLFLMNPNGILFGQNASLDVQGSFVGTTANALQFGEQEFFSATNPEVPSQLLTVNPSAFFFNQVTGDITNNSIAPTGATTPSGSPVLGLQVPSGHSLLLVGGNINIDGGRLNAFGGRIELGGLAESGSVGLEMNGALLKLSFSSDSILSNVNLLNDGIIRIWGNVDGDIFINSGAFLVSDGRILTETNGDEDAGDINIYAEQVVLLNNSTIGSFTSGNGNAGDIEFNTKQIELSNASTIASITNNSGDSGDIEVNTRRLFLRDGSYISTDAFSESTGQAGNLTVTATDSVEIVGTSPDLDASGLYAQTSGADKAGDLRVFTSRLSISGGGTISAETSGSGDGGNIFINASDSIQIVGGSPEQSFSSSISAGVERDASGDANNIFITTRQLTLRDGGFIASPVRRNSTGDAGNITINADSIELIGKTLDNDDRTGISVSVDEDAVGNSGDLTINTQRLSIRDGAGVFAQNFGSGEPGTIRISADDFVEVIGSANEISLVNATVGPSATGQPSNIEIDTATLRLQNSGQISTVTFGQLNAGDIRIQANDIDISGTSADNLFPSGILAFSIPLVLGEAGQGGNISIQTGRLQLKDGGQISASTFGQADAGSISVRAFDVISLDRSIISTTVETEAVGAGGNIDINTPTLALTNGAQLITTTFGQGDAGDLNLQTGQLSVQNGAGIFASTTGSSSRAGDITINADSVEMSGTSADRSSVSTISSQSETNPTTDVAATGDAGNVSITTRTLRLQDGAAISTNTAGQGRGGDLQVTARESAELSGTATLANGQVSRSRLLTGTSSSGRAGDLDLQTGQLSVQNGAGIFASTTGSSGRAGDITINADSVEMSGTSADRSSVSTISSQSEINPITGIAATGNAGNVNVATETLNLRDGAAISTNTAGQGRGGDLQVTARESAELSGTATLANGQVSRSSLSTDTFGPGRAGNLQVETSNLRIRGGAAITASTSGTGRAGNIQVDAGSIALNGTSRTQPRRQQLPSGIGSETSSAAENAGNAGNVRISTTRLNVHNRAVISTATSGQGNAGNIAIRSQETSVLNDGQIRSSILPGAVGDGGRITLQTRSLLVDRGQIAAVVSRQIENQGVLYPGGRGRGGDIFITATDRITLTGITSDGFSSGILTLSERGAEGSAGNITIRTGDFQIADGAIVVASTFNQGNGGNIKINADNFEAMNGGQVVTNTRAQGTAGTITLNAENITLTGIDPNFQNRRERVRRYIERPNITDRISDVIVNQGRASGLFANTSGRGEGGEISINTNNLTLIERAAISSASQRSGQAGNIRITASDRLHSEDGNITTNANQSTGGDIQLTSSNIDLSAGSIIRTDVNRGSGDGGDITVNADTVRLQDDSDIQTRVGENGAGDGGDITVTADSVIAFDDSDIITEAPNQGGDISLNTPVFLGAGYQEGSSTEGNSNGNNQVDLDASGAVNSGTVQTPDTSFIQNSLSDLPDDAVDADSLIANSCIARTELGGTFLVTGTGGLPPRPGTAPLSPYPAGTVRTEPDEEASPSSWHPGDPIVEPQDVYRLSDGRLVMSRECRTDSI